jgi:YD repeat-containing protein
MSLLLQSLASAQWVYLVKALLHTLWLGGLAAGGLYFVLRGKIDPGTRYRWCVGALLAVVLGGIVAWALLQPRPAIVHPTSAITPITVATPAGSATVSSPMAAVAVSSAPMDETEAWRWTPWLALVWLVGMAVMLTRAGSLVVEAEKLRRKSRPLENEAVLKLIEEARRKLGLMRRIQVVVTEQLTSPAVMGVIAPVLILPLAMVTALPPGQLQLILLHELAHIRRGDYLVNLCQLLTEALLFFNPAVWWISRQIRQEREACCDAMAIALAGERLQYAQALAQVAWTAMAAAPAFGDRRNPSGLKDRIQRLLVPGYCPASRPTWRALLTALFVGGGLLILSAIGARVTVAAILSPQERIERIEKKMIEAGQAPLPGGLNGNNTSQVKLSGKVRAADGSPVPEWISMETISFVNNSTSCGGLTTRNGIFSASVPAGTIYVEAAVPNFAPAYIGPLNGLATNQFENLEIVVQRGFDVPLQLVDEEDGKPVTDANVATMYWLHNCGFEIHHWKSGAAGVVALTHCADMQLNATVNAAGYEIMVKTFDHLSAGQPLHMALRRGAGVSGLVLDKVTGQPVAGAELHLLFQTGAGEQQRFQWDDASRVLGKTDAHGKFVLNQLRKGANYTIGATVPGHEAVLLENVSVGQSNLVLRAGPELVVHGRVIGSPELLRQVDDDYGLWLYSEEKYGNDSYGYDIHVPLHYEPGVTRFQFTNRMAGLAKLSTRHGDSFEREVDAPVGDWVIELGKKTPVAEAKTVPTREVVFHFINYTPGAPPLGTVQLQFPDSPQAAHMMDVEITNGEVRAAMAIGGRTAIEPRHMVGYWFDRVGENGHLLSIEVTNGEGPMVIEIPLVPAGAIYAKARNADGTPAGSLTFGVGQLKHAPGQGDNSLPGGTDGFSDSAPRKWVSGPLPLGGTYQVYAWRDNSFCLGKPVKLTGAKPDAEVELQFAPGKTFEGVLLNVGGKPLPDAEIKPNFTLENISGFGLKSVFTDEQGRFKIEDMTPAVGEYSVKVEVPCAMAENVKLDFDSQPQTIRLKRGRTLAGRVVQAGTGYAIPNAEVRTWNYDDTKLKLPVVTTRTDADGRFEFTTLADESYTFFVEEGQLLTDKKFRADGNTNLVLPVKLYEWSKVKPKAP